MENNSLKISIITVCLNSDELIEKTIKSVFSQKYSNIEYIIIDGGSTDRTLDIINKYCKQISTIISQKDNGIYDAMNRGIQYATGDYIYFLNSGDYFCNDMICERVVDAIHQNMDPLIIYGDIIYFDKDTRDIISEYRRNRVEFFAKGINHQSIFTHRDVYEKCGNFNAQYRIYGDFEWLSRATIKDHIKLIHISVPIVYYLKGGESAQHGRKFVFEKNSIICKYASKSEIIKYIICHPIGGISYLMYILGQIGHI